MNVTSLHGGIVVNTNLGGTELLYSRATDQLWRVNVFLNMCSFPTTNNKTHTHTILMSNSTLCKHYDVPFYVLVAIEFVIGDSYSFIVVGASQLLSTNHFNKNHTFDAFIFVCVFGCVCVLGWVCAFIFVYLFVFVCTLVLVCSSVLAYLFVYGLANVIHDVSEYLSVILVALLLESFGHQVRYF